MKVAIAGSGNVAQYLIEEFGASGHQIVVLTRSAKPEQKAFEQRQTDYSIASLVGVLEDCDALVSTVADFQNPPAATKAHLDMLEACRQSTKCKTFIPSEWTLNVEDYPEQPMFLAEANQTLHQTLKQETSIRWTIICNSWFADYVVPQRQRYLRDIGQAWPMDHLNKVFTIYGPGTQLFDLTSVRDVGRRWRSCSTAKSPGNSTPISQATNFRGMSCSPSSRGGIPSGQARRSHWQQVSDRSPTTYHSRAPTSATSRSRAMRGR